MNVSQTKFAQLPIPDLNSRLVHKIIQSIDVDLLNGDNRIPIYAIAEQLHVKANDISAHINTLQNLYYIRFADQAHEKILLTFNGRRTKVPYQ